MWPSGFGDGLRSHAPAVTTPAASVPTVSTPRSGVAARPKETPSCAADGWPGAIVVSGTASSCPIVHVAIKRDEAGGYEEADATVAGDGSWAHAFPKQFKAECGTPMEVVATCTSDSNCKAKAVLPVHCD